MNVVLAEMPLWFDPLLGILVIPVVAALLPLLPFRDKIDAEFTRRLVAPRVGPPSISQRSSDRKISTPQFRPWNPLSGNALSAARGLPIFA